MAPRVPGNVFCWDRIVTPYPHNFENLCTDWDHFNKRVVMVTHICKAHPCVIFAWGVTVSVTTNVGYSVLLALLVGTGVWPDMFLCGSTFCYFGWFKAGEVRFWCPHTLKEDCNLRERGDDGFFEISLCGSLHCEQRFFESVTKS